MVQRGFRTRLATTKRSKMAASVKAFHKYLFSFKSLRSTQLRNERFLSTSECCPAAEKDDGRPPTFTPPPKPVIVDKTQSVAALRKFLSPEFVPPRQRTNPVKFYMERKDMIRRRTVINLPEFYVGSILAVTMADPNASGKSNRFVGICIQRGGKGLGATFVLRNIINNQGVEICYELYNPRIQEIQILKLEKRLDDNLMYLRDALPEYSTVDPEMKPVPISPTGEVPVNMLKVKMRPKPWSKRWERPKFNIQGIRFDLSVSPAGMEYVQRWAMPWLEYDMLREYDTSKIEEQISSEIQRETSKLKIT
ncbi:39S ribosomal protein L19, mitochondrial [Syngnathoides biaculeatus]|uniref:39S ribosomal protein L19, mitochondrial n=1 Tax=Syngnathoides biaculeatus TaxID=300417 RepID=UPI002ADD9E94|nr:39S ribosomal protein L19, mitochondrial [Syngnathoides biaculeatus]